MTCARDRTDRGFTLLEVVVAVVLVGVVTAVAVAGIGSLVSSGAAASCSASLDAARTAIAVQDPTGTTPVRFDELVASGSISLPEGATVAPDGRTLATDSWTLVVSGTPAVLSCVPGALWTPADLGTSVAFWLDATTVAGGNGAPVGTWTSRDPATRVASTATSGWRPTLVSTGIGELPAVRFDGVDDRLSFDGTFLAGTDFTVAAVTAREAAFGRGYYLGSMGTTTPGTAFILGYDGNTIVRYSHRNDGINASVPGFGSVVPTLHVATSAASGRTLRLDGTLRGTASPLPLSTWSDAQVGRDSAGWFRGLVGEVVMVRSALSEADRQKLEGYLAWKWDTVATLAPGHPYRSAPPGA